MKYVQRFIITTILATMIVTAYLIVINAFFYHIQIHSLKLAFGVVSMIGAVTALIMAWRRYLWDKQLNMFIERLERIQTNNRFDSGNILLPPKHSLHHLATAVNKLQAWQRAQIEVTTQNESALNTLWNNMPIGAIEIAPDRRILRINLQALQMLDMTQTNLGQHYDDVIVNHQLMMLLEKTLTDKKHAQDMITLQHEGVKHILDTTTEYYETSAGHFVLLALFYDVTELVNLQLTQNQFIANASHELKTPLTSIIGFTDTLLQGAADDEQVRAQFLQIIADEARRLLALTQDILALAKVVDQSESVTDKDHIHLATLVNDVTLSQQTSIVVNQLQVQNLVSNEIAFDYPIDAVRQILTNLISNAVKYNRPSGQIVIESHMTDKVLKIMVSDTGIGISSLNQEHIFERFYRVDKSRNHNIPGTGLGLAIVHDLVTQLNGKIALESQVGVGTRVSVSLPL
ncbi:hypothetical protein H9L19_00315 [Weissella diestrammenae]|uniref:histidine kinase n=1 Tax=Weissella diestrammenae TaxID=1162633 RepID=A0A7G9T5L0_9LACO|nr:ATP-binding protein [Weissella diestrammenae]MCM0582212.1 hypothetical protein [Weissella diestrammenae]QNN75385.1 hypothetical protein H9L19_00315 [Weissella diestrammenae]